MNKGLGLWFALDLCGTFGISWFLQGGKFGFGGTFDFDGTLGFGGIFGFDGTLGLCGGLDSLNFSLFEAKSMSKITGKNTLCTKTL